MSSEKVAMRQFAYAIVPQGVSFNMWEPPYIAVITAVPRRHESPPPLDMSDTKHAINLVTTSWVFEYNCSYYALAGAPGAARIHNCTINRCAQPGSVVPKDHTNCMVTERWFDPPQYYGPIKDHVGIPLGPVHERYGFGQDKATAYCVIRYDLSLNIPNQIMRGAPVPLLSPFQWTKSIQRYLQQASEHLLRLHLVCLTHYSHRFYEVTSVLAPFCITTGSKTKIKATNVLEVHCSEIPEAHHRGSLILMDLHDELGSPGWCNIGLLFRWKVPEDPLTGSVLYIVQPIDLPYFMCNAIENIDFMADCHTPWPIFS
jgi:hypothetical protein